MAIEAPLIGARTSQLMWACCRLPSRNSQVMYSISAWPATRQIFLPARGRRETSMSVPRWSWEWMATTAPMKVSQMNSQRETSSLMAMPELKP